MVFTWDGKLFSPQAHLEQMTRHAQIFVIRARKLKGMEIFSEEQREQNKNDTDVVLR